MIERQRKAMTEFELNGVARWVKSARRLRVLQTACVDAEKPALYFNAVKKEGAANRRIGEIYAAVRLGPPCAW